MTADAVAPMLASANPLNYLTPVICTSCSDSRVGDYCVCPGDNAAGSDWIDWTALESATCESMGQDKGLSF